MSSANSLTVDDIKLSERLYIPQKRLRGFVKGKVGPKDGDDHVGGNYAIAVNFEANLPKLLPEATKTDVGLFVDFGNVWGVDYGGGIDESNTLRSAFGVSVDWFSPIGPLNFTFAEDITSASTDKPEAFRFNVGTTF